MIITIIVFLLILSILVLVHELGHFLVAKRLGIRVEEFGFGLPPRAFGIKRGETLYSVNWLPIGGFVKLYGEDEAGSGSLKIKKDSKFKNIHRAFFARPAWQRIMVVTAGVVMNFLLAVVIISYLFSVVGVPVPTVRSVVKGSPADIAGIRAGDAIVEINNKNIGSPAEIVKITKNNAGKEVKLMLLTKDNKEKTTTLTPRLKYPADQGPMGIAIELSSESKIKKYPWYQAPFLGTVEALKTSWLIITGILSMFYQLIIGGVVPKGVAGPVGIAQLTGQFVAVGPMAVLSFVALLSLNLAILNILPFPALDGGRLLFILVEVVIGRKISRKYEGYAHAIGMVILIALILLITIHDLIRVFTGQPVIPTQ